MAKSPAYSMYPDAFEQGTDEMTLSEVGAYIRLLNSQWNKGSVPGDSLDALSRILRCTRSTAKSVWAVIQVKFVRDEDGKWRNPRLEKERQKQAARRAKLAANGSKGAESRWQTDGNCHPVAITEPMANRSQNDGLPSPSPSLKTTTSSLPKAEKPIVRVQHTPLIAKRNLNAVHEHPRYDVPRAWHQSRVTGLVGGDDAMEAFYNQLDVYVDAHPNEDTHPRMAWLSGHFDAWVAKRAKPRPSSSDVPDVEETRRRLGIA
jgi:uncharacterized protein YdaU (DUF1376 family)